MLVFLRKRPLIRWKLCGKPALEFSAGVMLDFHPCHPPPPPRSPSFLEGVGKGGHCGMPEKQMTCLWGGMGAARHPAINKSCRGRAAQRARSSLAPQGRLLAKSRCCRLLRMWLGITSLFRNKKGSWESWLVGSPAVVTVFFSVNWHTVDILHSPSAGPPRKGRCPAALSALLLQTHSNMKAPAGKTN